MTNTDTPMDQDLPSHFMVGEEFVYDTNEKEVVFDICLYSPAAIRETEVYYDFGTIKLVQNEDHIKAITTRSISEKLLNAWLSGDTSSLEWLKGYISVMLPSINQEMMRQRHALGHFLIKTFSLFDIMEIRVVDSSIGHGIRVSGPSPITDFPPMSSFGGDFSERIYIKDLVDACGSFFKYEFDDCIRKVITSLDCFFKHYKLVRRKETKSKFIDLINQHLAFHCVMSDSSVAEELKQVYLVRNEIVHDGKKYPLADLQEMSKNAIHFLLDAYKFFEGDSVLKDYASNLESQFVAQLNHLGEVVTIDVLKKTSR